MRDSDELNIELMVLRAARSAALVNRFRANPTLQDVIEDAARALSIQLPASMQSYAVARLIAFIEHARGLADGPRSGIAVHAGKSTQLE
jgi:hypothetical protein